MLLFAWQIVKLIIIIGVTVYLASWLLGSRESFSGEIDPTNPQLGYHKWIYAGGDLTLTRPTFPPLWWC